MLKALQCVSSHNKDAKVNTDQLLEMLVRSQIDNRCERSGTRASTIAANSGKSNGVDTHSHRLVD